MLKDLMTKERFYLQAKELKKICDEYVKIDMVQVSKITGSIIDGVSVALIPWAPPVSAGLSTLGTSFDITGSLIEGDYAEAGTDFLVEVTAEFLFKKFHLDKLKNMVPKELRKHIANFVFSDKRMTKKGVEFCEEFVEKAFEDIYKLIAGTAEKALTN